MTNMNLYEGDFFTFLVSFTLLLLMHFNIKDTSTQFRNLRRSTILLFCASILSIFRWNVYLLCPSDLLSRFTHTIYYLSYITLSVSITYYFCEYFKLGSKKKPKTFIPFAVGGLILCTVFLFNLFYPVLFTIDHGEYIPLTYYPYFIGFFCLIIVGGVLLLFLTNLNHTTRRLRYNFYGLILTFLFASIINDIYFDGRQVLFSSLIVIYFLYLLFHSMPYFAKTGCLQSDSFNRVWVQPKIWDNSSCIMIMFLDFEYKMHLYNKTEEELYEIIAGYCQDFDALSPNLEAFLTSGYSISIMCKNEDDEQIRKFVRYMSEYLNSDEHRYFKFKIITYSCASSNMNSHLSDKCPINSFYLTTKADEDIIEVNEEILSCLRQLHKNPNSMLLYQQPIIEVHTNQYQLGEILTRLYINNLGIVFPDKYIDVAEKNGYIHDFSMILLRHTCEYITKLQMQHATFSRFSINFCSNELEQEDFAHEVMEVIRQYPIPCTLLAFEITESQSVHNFDQVKANMLWLKKQGIHFYLDDFGTGYSNLDRIISLPFDVIKFDRALVLKAEVDANTNELIRNLVVLFKKFNFEILFEGIETQEQEEMVIDMGADYLQGFKYSKPLPILDASHFFHPGADVPRIKL